MTRPAILLLMLAIAVKAIGQDSSRLIHYHLGFTVNYAGPESPDFALPVGGGGTLTVTMNAVRKLKPVIEVSAVGFPEYVLHLINNTGNADTEYAYGVYSLLAGTKLNLNQTLRASLISGPSFNSRENAWRLGIKPAIELHSKRERVALQLFYLNIVNSRIMDGYAGVAFLIKLR